MCIQDYKLKIIDLIKLFPVLLTIAFSSLADPKTIILPGTNEVPNYHAELLEMALSYVPKNKYKVRLYGTDLPINRAFKMLTQNKGVDVVPALATIHRDLIALAVAKPTTQCLSSIRAPYINTNKSSVFDAVTVIDSLKPLIAGAGRGRLEANVLRAHGLQVMDTSYFANGLGMLANERFDYYPASILENNHLNQTLKDIQLSDLLIYFPSPSVFYVNKSNQKLAADISLGLQRMEQDGSMNHLLKQYFDQKKRRVLANVSKVIILSNPFLPSIEAYKKCHFWQNPNLYVENS